MTLSLTQIGEIAGLGSAAEAERLLREMIVSGSIHATIDQQKGMVRFLESPERYDSHATAVQMETALQGAIALASRLHELHASLATDSHYLARVTSHERQPQWDDESGLFK
jgi:hypothetical protein